MKKFFLINFYILMVSFSINLEAQNANQDSSYNRFSIGSSLFMVANLVPDDNSADFVQINFGYKVNKKNAVSLEFQTWKYAWSLGIPYGKMFEDPELKFPGYIREYGFTIVYQHFWWKGLYNAVHVMSAWQRFVNEEGIKIDNGFQIFNTYRLGYYFTFFKDRIFFQPSIAVTHRPFHTEMPEQFKKMDEKHSKFFIGEPGLHVGINF